MSRKNVCLLYTGGTIGMKESETGLAPDSTRAAFHAILTEAERGGIEIIELLNKDSTNISPLDWTTIAKAILERLDQFDGFVVAHGTDTMHFSASAVAFALGHPLSKPVVFTGSQTIPDVSHGDARINLLRAIEVACKEDLGEVVISFGDFVFRGSRAQKKDERKFDAFESPACPPLGEFIGDGIELFGASAPGPHLGDRHIDFARGVIQFSLIPGLEPELVLAAASHSKCQGVILQSFGAGNIPSEGQLSLGPVIRHITGDLAKPVIVTSQFPANSTDATQYETGLAAVEAGATPTGNMTASCAAAKFRWAIGRSIDDSGECDTKAVAEIMNTVYIREMDQNGKE